MKNLKVRTKVVMLAVGLICIAIFMCMLSITKLTDEMNQSLDTLEATLNADYDTNIKEQVDTTIKMIESIYQKSQQGVYSLEESKQLAAEIVRSLRYGESGYFWVDTYEGDNVVLLGSETEGTNRLDTVDVNGFRMVENIINVGKQPDGGFTEYWFPKEGEAEASPKRSYSKAFEPYQWVVGTGNYTDYIDNEIATLRAEKVGEVNNVIMEMAIILIVVLCISMFITGLFSRQLGSAFNSICSYLRQVASGDFTAKLPKNIANRKDDFGTLITELENMKSSVSGLIKQTNIEADKILDVVNQVTLGVNELNSNLEDVSATTEELAAGMEETSAASQEMLTASQEIDMATKVIAEKSSQGAELASEIYKRADVTKSEVDMAQQVAGAMRQEIEEKLKEALENVKIVEQIHVLSESIMTITGQTNLLALNAAIEAARAGEAGRGFSVVADEIRNLAEQSKNTVVKIQEVTEQVTESVNNLSDSATKLLDFVSTKVNQDYDRFGDVAEEYHKDANYINDLIQDFSETAEGLKKSIDSVMTAINEVSQASEQGAIGTSDIAEKVMEVTNKSMYVANQVSVSKESSIHLHEEIGKFQLED